MTRDITQLLNAIDSGEPQAAEELLPLVYEELRRLAAQKLANENSVKPSRPLRWFMRPGFASPVRRATGLWGAGIFSSRPPRPFNVS